MASATGIPEQQPDNLNREAETQPLLGRPGDNTQRPNQTIFHNLFTGTASLAQGGAALLVALVWSAIFSHPPLIPLFSPHPLLQSIGVFLVIQAILILQPTYTPTDKRTGARAHAILNLLSFTVFLAGVLIIEANKIKQGPQSHFHSLHGYLGVATSVVLLVQYAVGLLMWACPGWLGVHVLRAENTEEGEARAKQVWKYHRGSGYVLVLVLLLATVVTATGTAFNENVLKIKTWAVGLAVAFVVVGVYPRVKLAKLGIRRGE